MAKNPHLTHLIFGNPEHIQTLDYANPRLGYGISTNINQIWENMI